MELNLSIMKAEDSFLIYNKKLGRFITNHRIAPRIQRVRRTDRSEIPHTQLRERHVRLLFLRKESPGRHRCHLQ